MAKDKAASGASTIPLVAVSLLLIVALMGWLFMQERNRPETTVAEGDSAAAPGAVASGVAPSQVLTNAVFGPNVRSYVDQVIEITDARFSSALSPQTFFLELPSGEPFLVRLDSALVAAGVTAPTGGPLDIIGTVKHKDAATVAQWRSAGVLQTQDQVMQAEFGANYLEAHEIRPAQ